jgi:hypothetical protein
VSTRSQIHSEIGVWSRVSVREIYKAAKTELCPRMSLAKQV